MYNIVNVDESIPVVTRTMCDFHQRYPGVVSYSCGCSLSLGIKTATPEEYAQRRRRRLIARRVELQKELWIIDNELNQENNKCLNEFQQL